MFCKKKIEKIIFQQKKKCLRKKRKKKIWVKKIWSKKKILRKKKLGKKKFAQSNFEAKRLKIALFRTTFWDPKLPYSRRKYIYTLGSAYISQEGNLTQIIIQDSLNIMNIFKVHM